MRKLVVSSLCAVALLALVACEPIKSPPPSGGGGTPPPPPPPTGPPPVYVGASGTPSHYLTVTYNSAHGNLVTFAAYYEDGYIHGDFIPASNGPVNDLEHYTCLNIENGGNGRPPECPADQLLSVGPNAFGKTDQAHTGYFNNVRADKHPGGSGPALQWTTYEHQGHTQFEFDFADGYELYVTLPQASTPPGPDGGVYPHVWDLHLVAGSGPSAVFSSTPLD